MRNSFEGLSTLALAMGMHESSKTPARGPQTDQIDERVSPPKVVISSQEERRVVRSPSVPVLLFSPNARQGACDTGASTPNDKRRPIIEEKSQKSPRFGVEAAWKRELRIESPKERFNARVVATAGLKLKSGRQMLDEIAALIEKGSAQDPQFVAVDCEYNLAIEIESIADSLTASADRFVRLGGGAPQGQGGGSGNSRDGQAEARSLALTV